MHRKLLLLLIAMIMAATPAFCSGKKKNKVDTSKELKAVNRGRALYRLYQCADCHSIKNEGNKEGVSLDKIGTKRSSKFLLEQILDPEKHVESNPKKFNGDPNLMPSQQLEKAEAEAIVIYLKSLR